MMFPRLDKAVVASLRALWWKARRRDVVVPGWVQQERAGECEGCEWLDSEDRQCLECTCFVDLKTWIASESCPQGKWDIYLDEKQGQKHSKVEP